MSSGKTLRPPTMMTSLMRPHSTSSPSSEVGEVAGAQPPVAEQLGGGVGALVVAGRHRRAPDLELADLAIAQHLAGLRIARCGSRARAPACRAAAGGGRSRRRGRRLRDLLGSSTLPVDDVAHHAPHRRRGRCRRSRPRPCRRRRTRHPGGSRAAAAAATKASTASGSIGSAPFSAMRIGERSSPLIRSQRARGQHPREVRPGGRRAAVGRDPLHPARRDGRGSPAAPPAPSRHRSSSTSSASDETHVVVQRQPRHDDVDVVVELGRLGRSRRGSSRARARASSRPWARSSIRS